jgi:putative transcriptional regulator
MADSLHGNLLVATPKLLDPNFARTVILICTHDDDGAMGLVLNSPLAGAGLSGHVPAWSGFAAPPGVVFRGGPVEPEAGLGLGLFAAPADVPGWTPITGRVGLLDLSQPPEDVPGLLRARIFAGYAGWGAQQIQDEIAEGAWFVLDAEEDDAFAGEPAHLWRQVLRRQQGRIAMFAYSPIDPRAN